MESVHGMSSDVCSQSESRSKSPCTSVADKPFNCYQCGMTFRLRFTLEAHIRTHTGDRPFACHICDARFRQQSHKETHVHAVHHKERPYACAVCDKTFAYKSVLRNHEKIHSKERPHNCEICEKGFSDRAALRKHRVTHDGIKPYLCGVCGKRFSRKFVLERHFKAKHPAVVMEWAEDGRTARPEFCSIQIDTSGSDDSSDDEDDPNTTIPAWASETKLHDKILEQQHQDADTILKYPI